MILAFEMTWTGAAHAPVNAAMLQIVAQAFPAHEIRVFANREHLIELQRDESLTAISHVSFRKIDVSPYYLGKTHIVSWRRFIREILTLGRTLYGVNAREDCLILLLSGTPTAIFAASWFLSLLRRRRLGVQIILHGNLNEIKGWRSRNPVTRRFDLVSVLSSRGAKYVRFLTLEGAIREELIQYMPRIAPRVDVLPHPVNVSELGSQPVPRLSEPIKVGLVGQGTKAKGFDVFLKMAHDLKERFGNRIELHHVGQLGAGIDPSTFSNLAHPAATVALDRSEFTKRLASLHYVFLPYRPGYYNLSASGALIDAITWLKPVIASDVPFVAELFNKFGDIGFLFRKDEELHAIFDIIMSVDNTRYFRQIEALKRLRESRTPSQLAVQYAQMISLKYDGLLGGNLTS